ncbi:hypothetical protein V7S79_08220 [Aquirufa sp. ROCK-SH2]
MRRILAWFLFVLFAFVLVCTGSDASMKWINKLSNHLPENLQSDKYTFGDLYGFTYLPQFRIVKDPSYVELPSYLDTIQRTKDLFILCDSYLYSSFEENSTYFKGVKNAYFTRWTEDTLINSNQLKSSNSILLIECVERNAIMRLKLSEVNARIAIAKPELKQSAVAQNTFKFPSLHDLNEAVKQVLYHKTLETNLDFILFSRGVFRKIKELKASLNLNWFQRIDHAASLAHNSSFLYLKETIDPSVSSSSFYPFTNQEIDSFVSDLNEINDYYLKAGFKRVLISIPANPVAILQTEKSSTNQLLNRLKKHPNLKVEIIDPSDSLKVNASQNYFKSDSHWNKNGAKIWLEFLNRSLAKSN